MLKEIKFVSVFAHLLYTRLYMWYLSECSYSVFRICFRFGLYCFPVWFFLPHTTLVFGVCPLLFHAASYHCIWT